jgi:hypothetical protein
LHLILGYAEQALARDGKLPLYVRELTTPESLSGATAPAGALHQAIGAAAVMELLQVFHY